MTKEGYKKTLIEIGYGPVEAEYVMVTTAWSQIQLENTARCKEMLYDLEGKGIKNGKQYSWDRGYGKDAVMKMEDLEEVKCNFEYEGF